jgi:hypothetical protein
VNTSSSKTTEDVVTSIQSNSISSDLAAQINDQNNIS